ncbi:MAG: glucoamylase family protein [Bacteroidota bacterium]
MKKLFCVVFVFSLSHFAFSQNSANKKYFEDGFLDTLQHRTFNYFWECVDPKTGLTPDRYPSLTFSSTAAIGFALTSYGIGAERKYISREAAADRVLTTIRYLYYLPQGDAMMGTAGYRGFYYHFLDLKKGTRFNKDIELSTVDTAWLLAGILFCQSYFNNEKETEQAIRAYADSMYHRIDWQWLYARPPLMSMGWYPEKGIHPSDWKGYDESMILYILALGSPTSPIPSEAWNGFTRTSLWMKYYGLEFISFGPLFGHQFSHSWIDFRGIKDSYMREKGIDYFENSRRATLTHQAYAKENPKKLNGYSENIWGLTACDGPADETRTIEGIRRQFFTYRARGVSADWVNDDGTIAPTAAGGSIAFAPEISLPALKAMRNSVPELWTKYGFLDAFNLTYVTDSTPNGWIDHDYIGIDQGPIVIMIENLRSELVWNVMKKNPYVVKGLQRAGFTGGWLENYSKKK